MKSDLALIHAPSIYDFRKRNLREGPISDVVPSTPLFEMYPVGFVSMLNYAIKHGYSGRICNLAVHMLADDKFDVPKYIEKVDADLFGIDLHWMPHVHGAIQVSRLIKAAHPDKKIVFGGFSSSYFAEELLHEVPEIDFVLKGDYMEKPLIMLMEAIQEGKPLSSVNSLVYRDAEGVKTNLPMNDPDPASDVFIDYSILVKTSLKYHDIRGHLPYLSWIKNPVGMTIIQHGCQYNCGFCGGSNFAYGNRYHSTGLVKRDPVRIAEEVEIVQDTIASPVFIAGDICQTGEKYYTKLFNEFKSRGIDLPLLTEYFVPPGRQYFEVISKNVDQFMCEISPDSSDIRIRQNTGRYYDNDSLAKSVDLAAEFGSKKFDIYFSIGLPHQTKDDVLTDADFLEKFILDHRKENMPIYGFISPLTPFLDVGSLFYEMPDRYGFRIKTKHLMDFYNLLENGRSWDDFINYETEWMSKKDMVEATYLSGIKMVEVGSRLGYVRNNEKDAIVENIMSYLNGMEYTPHEDKSKHLTYLVKELDWSNRHTITFVSTGVFAYSVYQKFRKLLSPN